MALFLFALLACDDKDTTTGSSAGGWQDVYGQCADGSQNVVPVSDLGSPLAYFVEVEGPNGWMPLALNASNLDVPTIFRNEDTGLWLVCPDGVTSYHVSWMR